MFAFRFLNQIKVSAYIIYQSCYNITIAIENTYFKEKING